MFFNYLLFKKYSNNKIPHKKQLSKNQLKLLHILNNYMQHNSKIAYNKHLQHKLSNFENKARCKLQNEINNLIYVVFYE